MTLDTNTLTLLALGAIAGLLVGFAIALIMRMRAGAALAKRESELKDQATLEEERAAALDLASERLSHVFDKLANEQFQSHSETFLKLARESLGLPSRRNRIAQEKAPGRSA